MEEFIKVFKTTTFYSDIVAKMFICEETPNTLWFTAKRPYSKRDEITLWNVIDKYDYEVCDAAFAFNDTDNDAHAYKLMEVMG